MDAFERVKNIHSYPMLYEHDVRLPMTNAHDETRPPATQSRSLTHLATTYESLAIRPHRISPRLFITLIPAQRRQSRAAIDASHPINIATSLTNCGLRSPPSRPCTAPAQKYH
jgi:hypothetical protein